MFINRTSLVIYVIQPTDIPMARWVRSRCSKKTLCESYPTSNGSPKNEMKNIYPANHVVMNEIVVKRNRSPTEMVV